MAVETLSKQGYWRRLRAGKYESADSRFFIARQRAFEVDDPDYDGPRVPVQWFLYDREDMVDGYDTLRAAKAVAERRRYAGAKTEAIGE